MNVIWKWGVPTLRYTVFVGIAATTQTWWIAVIAGAMMVGNAVLSEVAAKELASQLMLLAGPEKQRYQDLAQFVTSFQTITEERLKAVCQVMDKQTAMTLDALEELGRYDSEKADAWRSSIASVYEAWQREDQEIVSRITNPETEDAP